MGSARTGDDGGLVALYYLLPLDHIKNVPVTVQMLLNLLALGLVVRAFAGPVQFARQQATPADPPGQTR